MWLNALKKMSTFLLEVQINNLDNEFFRETSLPSHKDLPDEFTADPSDRYTFPDGKRKLIATNGTQTNPATINIYMLTKKKDLDYAVVKRKISEPDMLQYADMQVCPQSPVCALISFREAGSDYRYSPSGFFINIYDPEKDTVIGTLKSSSEYQKYLADVKKYLADSVVYANKIIDDSKKSVANKTEIGKVIKGILEEGWTIENIKYGVGPYEKISIHGDQYGVWNFTPNPNRIYSYLGFTTYYDITTVLRSERQAAENIQLNDSIFHSISYYLEGTPVRYLLSNAFYQTKPNDPVSFGIEFRCLIESQDCQQAMADSNKFCRIIISRQKAAEKELTIKTLNAKIKVLDLSRVYENVVKIYKENDARWAVLQRENKKKEQEEIRKVKEAEKNAPTARKLFAQYKAQKPKTEIVRYEIYDTLIPGLKILPLPTNFPPDVKRIVLVAVKGKDQYVSISTDLDGSDVHYTILDKIGQMGKVQEGAYSISTVAVTAPTNAIQISSNGDTAIIASIMLLTEKDAAGKMEYDKQKEKEQQQIKESKDQQRLTFSKENADNDIRVKKIRTLYEKFSRTMNDLYNNAKNNGENWTLNKQITEFNKARDAVTSLQNGISDNLPSGYNSNNPSVGSYKKWFDKAQVTFNEIFAKAEKLKGYVEEKKDANKPVLSFLFYTPLQEMAYKADNFNSFLNENPK